jgi:hypothetical protein
MRSYTEDQNGIICYFGEKIRVPFETPYFHRVTIEYWHHGSDNGAYIHPRASKSNLLDKFSKFLYSLPYLLHNNAVIITQKTDKQSWNILREMEVPLRNND